MEDQRNQHLKVQEMIDCYATSDPLKEMAALAGEADSEEAATKWLALATLHAVNQGAEKIKLSIAPDGTVSVKAKYREANLPSPGPEVGGKVVAALRAITQAGEVDKYKCPVSLGIRNDSIMIEVKLEREKGKEKVSLDFGE